MQDNHGIINAGIVSDIQTSSDPTAALHQDHEKYSNSVASQTIPHSHKTHGDQVMHHNPRAQSLWKRVRTVIAVATVRRDHNDSHNRSLQDPNRPPRTGLHQVRYVTAISYYDNNYLPNLNTTSKYFMYKLRFGLRIYSVT